MSYGHWPIHPSLPKEFDERVATLHFPALGAALNVLAQEQPDYIGFTVEAPFGLLPPTCEVKLEHGVHAAGHGPGSAKFG